MAKKPDQRLPVHDGLESRELARLYAMTEDESIEETLSWIENDHSPEARFPIERWKAAQGLIKWHLRYQDGDKSAILEALYLCMLNDLPVPRWCAMGYLTAFRDVIQYRAKSWDDVFGKPHNKGVHLEAKREHREKSFLVYYRIKDILGTEPETPIDGYLFERVGKNLGIGGKTKTETWYYEWKNILKK